MGYMDKKLEDRSFITSLIGELHYDKVGAKVFEKNQEVDDRLVKKMRVPVMPIPLLPPGDYMITKEKGKTQIYTPWLKFNESGVFLTPKEILEEDKKRGDLTKENKWVRTLIALSPYNYDEARERQLAQDLEQRYFEYAKKGIDIIKVEEKGDKILLFAENGDILEFDKKDFSGDLKKDALKKFEKIRNDFKEENIKQYKESNDKERLEEWFATAPYETRLRDGKLRGEVNPDLPKEDPLNVNATSAFGAVIESASEDKEITGNLKQKDKNLAKSLEIAGDVVKNNHKWLLDDKNEVKPNVSPSNYNATMENVKKYGPGVAVGIGAISSLSFGLKYFIYFVLVVAVLFVAYLAWKVFQENKKQKVVIKRGGVNGKARH